MTKAFICAMRLLARREHGMRELTDKLICKGYSKQDSQQAVIECQRQGMQNDARFVEAVGLARIRQGYGPLRIIQELRGKHIDSELIQHFIDEQQEQWEVHALHVWRKKFKEKSGVSFPELQKQQRFLLYRGFSADTIAKLFKPRDFEIPN